ncbi:hypothetical protein V8C86DRAFT_2910133, partial [Haematococcus lacustris]
MVGGSAGGGGGTAPQEQLASQTAPVNIVVLITQSGAQTSNISTAAARNGSSMATGSGGSTRMWQSLAAGVQGAELSAAPSRQGQPSPSQAAPAAGLRSPPPSSAMEAAQALVQLVRAAAAHSGSGALSPAAVNEAAAAILLVAAAAAPPEAPPNATRAAAPGTGTRPAAAPKVPPRLSKLPAATDAEAQAIRVGGSPAGTSDPAVAAFDAEDSSKPTPLAATASALGSEVVWAAASSSGCVEGLGDGCGPGAVGEGLAGLAAVLSAAVSGALGQHTTLQLIPLLLPPGPDTAAGSQMDVLVMAAASGAPATQAAASSGSAQGVSLHVAVQPVLGLAHPDLVKQLLVQADGNGTAAYLALAPLLLTPDAEQQQAGGQGGAEQQEGTWVSRGIRTPGAVHGCGCAWSATGQLALNPADGLQHQVTLTACCLLATNTSL